MRVRIVKTLAATGALALLAAACGNDSDDSEAAVVDEPADDAANEPADDDQVDEPADDETAELDDAAETEFLAEESGLQAILDQWRAGADVSEAILSVRVPGRGDIHLASRADGSDAETPPSTDGTYGIASVTKTFTAAAALQLVDEGGLSLDEPVQDGLPELSNADEITLAMLLSHTSGLGDVPDRVTGDDPNAISTLGQPPVGKPGEAFAYSNAGFAAVGQMIERELDQDLVTVIQERFVEPLSLDDTLLSEGLPSPGYGMVSSSEDMLAWGEALYSGEVLGEETTATMLEMRIPFFDFYGFGTMGFCLDKTNCTPDKVELVGHMGNGGVDGSITLLVHHRDSRATAVAHANTDDIGILVGMVPLVIDSLNELDLTEDTPDSSG